MDADVREQLTSQVSTLRLELKAWEKDFAANKGSKPSREDIKANPSIGI